MKLALGTVQFGLDYGVTNTSGKLSDEACQNILTLAEKSGLNTLDTAAAYGVSEDILGHLAISQRFKVISKVPALLNSNPEMIQEYVQVSLSRLKRKQLDGVLLHSELDLLGDSADSYFKQLTLLKSQKLAVKIGVSCYSVEAAMMILNRFDIDLIQIPASHLDRRFEHSGVLALAKSKGVEVHARSLFLQGLLVVEPKERPSKFKNIIELEKYDTQAKKLELTQLQLAVSYIIKTPDIDYAVVGCLTADHLVQIIDAYNHCLTLDVDIEDLSTENMSLINPVNW
jgi:aryl-alcohol dehydrogenase-like predicted oxidoreductase